MYQDVGDEGDELGDRNEVQKMQGLRAMVRRLHFVLREPLEGLMGNDVMSLKTAERSLPCCEECGWEECLEAGSPASSLPGAGLQRC